MQSLKQRMEQYGFISHSDYEFVLRSLKNASANHVPAINIEGEPGRRKTAFANALAQALESPHLRYFEFGLEQKSPLVIQIDNEHQTVDIDPMDDFDKIMIECCALSEAEPTILILDQLHLANFKDHMSLYNFIVSKSWNSGNNKYIANINNLMLILISESPLYHALQHCSFKVWVDSLRQPGKAPTTHELGLEEAAAEWITAVDNIFQSLELNPTLNSYQKIAFDIEHHVRSADQLRQSIYGWVEGVNYPQLFSEEMTSLFAQAETAIENYIGIEDAIELSALPPE
jgi:hypothetical protein